MDSDSRSNLRPWLRNLPAPIILVILVLCFPLLMLGHVLIGIGLGYKNFQREFSTIISMMKTKKGNDDG